MPTTDKHPMRFIQRGDENTFEAVIREYRGYTLAKEWYAHGISLFDYTVTKEGTQVYESFNTLREAKDWIDKVHRGEIPATDEARLAQKIKHTQWQLDVWYPNEMRGETHARRLASLKRGLKATRQELALLVAQQRGL